jgi:alkanesulfonate monooxygenase SsuD/methylene tetrahydromethanopterin reductase-like flavin-dependent oxidoreductase (luciferase family)
MLAEGLEVLTGLWSGKSFSCGRSYYQMKETLFMPEPGQSPRIPNWVAAFWPNKAPVHHAARWDGIFALNRDAITQDMIPVS